MKKHGKEFKPTRAQQREIEDGFLDVIKNYPHMLHDTFFYSLTGFWRMGLNITWGLMGLSGILTYFGFKDEAITTLIIGVFINQFIVSFKLRYVGTSKVTTVEDLLRKKDDDNTV